MKKLNVIFIICFFLLLALPAVSMPFFTDDENTENRTLSEFPSLRTEDGINEEFSEELTTWIREHIGFRNKLIAAENALRSGLFGSSAEESIVAGKNGWLYYADTLPDYLNIPSLTLRNARNAAHALKMMQDYAAERDCLFTAALIPNKNTLYPGQMPDGLRPLEAPGNRELLEAAMQAEGVRYADVTASLMAEQEVLYQETDSHWNYKGALTGYRTIMDSLGLPYERFEGLGFTAREDWEADLARSLYGIAAKPEVQLYPDREFTYEITSHETAVNALTLTTRQTNAENSIVFYRDSFLNTMQVYVAESFRSALFSRVTPYQAELIDRYKANAAVLEIVERNIINLAQAAPVMAAAETELTVSGQVLSPGTVSFHTAESGKLRHFWGTLPEALLGDEYRVYFLVTNEGEDKAYEAFPIYEKELLGSEENGDNGWSVYLENSLLTEGAAYALVFESAGQSFYQSFN